MVNNENIFSGKLLLNIVKKIIEHRQNNYIGNVRNIRL